MSGSTRWRAVSRSTISPPRSPAARTASCCRNASPRTCARSTITSRPSRRRPARRSARSGSSRSLPRRLQAVFALGGYAGVSPRLEAITWGAEDLAACLGGNNRTIERRLRRSVQAGALAVPAGRGGGRYRCDRHDLHRFSRRGRSQSRMRGGAPLRVRREDGDPSGAARRDQRSLLGQRRRARLGRARRRAVRGQPGRRHAWPSTAR